MRLTYCVATSDLQEGEVILDVLFVLQDVSLEVHEGACISLGAQRGLGQHVLGDTLQEGHDTLVLHTLYANTHTYTRGSVCCALSSMNEQYEDCQCARYFCVCVCCV